MFNKLNTKTLAITFGILLIVVIAVQLFKGGKQSDRNFASQLFSVDTAKVSSIIITPKGNPGDIKLVRSGNTWTLVSGGKTYKTEKGIAGAMLNELQHMKADRVVATEKSEWTQFEVTDTTSTRVRVEEGDNLTADFRIGKFSFQQPNTMTTYIRLSDNDQVYAINGLPGMTFNRNTNDLRDKTLVDVNAGDITKITFTYPADSSFVLTRVNNTWKIDNNEWADSAKTAEFITGLAHLISYDLADDAIQQGKEVFSVSIEGKNLKPVKLQAFEADTSIKYIITSTFNEDAHFNGTKNDLASHIFAGKIKFKKQKANP
jgi:hypothetical protein